MTTLILSIKVSSAGKEWFLIDMTKLFRSVVMLTAIYDRVLIVSFYFRETIHATAFSDERLLWKEEKSHTSINAVNNELSNKLAPCNSNIYHKIKNAFASVLRNYKKKVCKRWTGYTPK